MSLVAFPSHASDIMLTKRQLAEHLGRSERWIELKMRDGLPCLPRTDRQGRRMFRLRSVEAWLADGQPKVASAAERLSQLEAQVARLTAKMSELERAR